MSQSQDEHICFNIGGKRYETYKSTILKYPNTLLATMLSERNKDMLQKNSKGKARPWINFELKLN